MKIDCQHDCQPSEKNVKKIAFEICKNSAVAKPSTLNLTEEQLLELENDCLLLNEGGDINKILKRDVQ